MKKLIILLFIFMSPVFAIDECNISVYKKMQNSTNTLILLYYNTLESIDKTKELIKKKKIQEQDFIVIKDSYMKDINYLKFETMDLYNQIVKIKPFCNKLNQKSLFQMMKQLLSIHSEISNIK